MLSFGFVDLNNNVKAQEEGKLELCVRVDYIQSRVGRLSAYPSVSMLGGFAIPMFCMHKNIEGIPKISPLHSCTKRLLA